MSLPDACADLLLAEMDSDRERETEDWESANEGGSERGRQRDVEPDTERWTDDQPNLDCCRTLSGSGSLRCASSASLRAQPALHIPLDNSRPGTCRREGASRSADTAQHRQSLSSCSSRTSGCASGGAGGGAGARLSAMVPDVAMAPNANTHLLTARDYFRHAPPWEYSGGGVLQLDLGDGATHTPRPGSRAARAGAAHARHSREHAPGMSCLRSRADEDELRAAIELSVIRAYSSSRAPAGAAPLLLGGSQLQHPQQHSQQHPQQHPQQHAQHPSILPPTHRQRSPATLPHTRGERGGRAQLAPTHHNPVRSRASASPQRTADLQPPHHAQLSRLGSVAAEATGSRSPSPGTGGQAGGPGPHGGPGGPTAAGPASPRPHDLLYRHAQHTHYRLEPSYSGSSSGSRHTYA